MFGLYAPLVGMIPHSLRANREDADRLLQDRLAAHQANDGEHVRRHDPTLALRQEMKGRTTDMGTTSIGLWATLERWRVSHDRGSVDVILEITRSRDGTKIRCQLYAAPATAADRKVVQQLRQHLVHTTIANN